MKYRATMTVRRDTEEIGKAVFIGTEDDYFTNCIISYVGDIIMKDIPEWVLTQPMKDFIYTSLWDVTDFWYGDFYDGYEKECNPVFNLNISILFEEM